MMTLRNKGVDCFLSSILISYMVGNPYIDLKCMTSIAEHNNGIRTSTVTTTLKLSVRVKNNIIG